MTDKNDKNEKEDFAALLAEFDQRGPKGKHRREVHLGDVVRGRIISIGRDGAFVELEGGKAEGMLDNVDVRDEDGKLKVAVGDVVEARVVETERKAGCIVLRRSIGTGPTAKAELEQAFRAGLPVEGRVTGLNKGGVDVDIAGARAFCPISQLDTRHVEDASTFIGQKLVFRITRYESDKRGANLVVSRRALLEEEGRARAAVTRAKLAPGAVLGGVVTSLRDFGAFVDLGGIEGLLHISEIGHARVEKPGDVLALGQKVTVQVLKIEKRDDPKRPEQISLSLKALAADPWHDAAARLGEGTKVRGTVTHVEPFGAFVELGGGVEGLLHASELAQGKPVRNARDLVKPGQTVDVTVLAIDREKRRVSLGLQGGDEALDAEAVAHARRAEGQGFGTLGDLFKKR